MNMIQMTIKLSIFTIMVLFIIMASLLWNKKTYPMPTIIKKESMVMTKIELTKEEKQLMGSWVESIPGEKKEFQGFTLYSDGTAGSINTGKLLYKTWRVRGENISLVVESEGKGFESQDMETYAFEQVSKNTLLLKIGKSTFTYKRV